MYIYFYPAQFFCLLIFKQPRYTTIPIVLYETLTELQALRLGDFAMPSRETLQSLFKSVQHLSYLRYDMIPSDNKNVRIHSSALVSSSSGPFHRWCDYISMHSNVKNFSFFQEETKSGTFIDINCSYYSITTKEYQYKYSLGHAYHDEKLDRIVVLNKGLERKFHSPKVGAFEIDWIQA